MPALTRRSAIAAGESRLQIRAGVGPAAQPLPVELSVHLVDLGATKSGLRQPYTALVE